MNGLVYGQRYDYTWYGPCGHSKGDARQLASRANNVRPAAITVEHQRSGAVLYSDGTDDPEGLAIWIPSYIRPGGHGSDVDAWMDSAEEHYESYDDYESYDEGCGS